MITDQAVATSSPRTVRTPRTAQGVPSLRPGRAGTSAGAAGRNTPPAEDTLDAVFTRAARRWPGAVAVQDARGGLGFATAELRATQLASVLTRGGVQLGDPVIVHCDDHRQAVVAQLAVLKAGGVCVPAAHGLGRTELRAIAALSGASTVLCSRSTQDAWPRRCASLPLDDQQTWRRVAAHRPERALPLSSAREAAYLLVSGEGPDEPTGHLIDHHAWRLAIAARTRAAGPAPRQVFVSAPPASPRALSAMWWAFASGGSLRTLPGAGSPAERVGPVCAVVFSPDEYAAVVDTLPIRPRLVQLLGGPVPGELVARHFAALPDTRLRADFAPRGGALPWTSREFAAQAGALPSPSTLGTPVPEVRVHVVDGRGRPLAAGQEGELCAAGPALPFGTIRRPGRTAAAWEDAPLLRSGVPGRRLADGGLELTEPPPTAA
ncbi:AMP-binding protein [Streptomyces sp. NPDC101151]|uniref:AMP-binding protein n=1 Tax=Streptomyces sp. NPDC101151 TaxID=3366115 RepID=UPI0038234348